MKKILILILALFVIQGCALTSAYEEMPTLPTKPELPSLQRTPDGGIMLDKRDAGELMRYILDLERGFELPSPKGEWILVVIANCIDD